MITVSIEVTFDCEKPKIQIEKHRNSKILFIENLAKITNIYCPAKVLLIDINWIIHWKYLLKNKTQTLHLQSKDGILFVLEENNIAEKHSVSICFMVIFSER
jgi:hypothetical protein